MNSTTGTFTLGRPEFKLVISWIPLCSSVVLHVMDEATRNFLAVYNQSAMTLRERVPWLRLPVFTFRLWIKCLAIAIALRFSLPLFLLRGARWVRPIVGVLSVLMIASGLNHAVGTILGHTVASVHFARPMPGFYSAPTLIAASI